MPCSAIFRGCIRTTSTFLLSVSLRRTARTYFTAPKSLKPSQLVFFTRNRPPGIGGSNVRFYSRPRVASSVVESERRVRQRRVSTPFWYKQSASYGRFSFLELLNDELDSGLVVGQQQSGASTFDDIDEWRSKLTMLLNDNDMQEVVSREKKDRRDFQKISVLANEMGLHSRQYEKVVVFSKVPLPNYRPDLDDKRPQREVDLPLGLLREVDAHLKAYLSQNNSHVGGSSDNYVSGSSSIESVAADEGLYKHHYPDPLIRNTAAMEAILLGRSSEMRNKQRDWLESPEGQKMLELRRSLPAFNERDALLKAISENQVIVVSGQTGCGKTTQVPQYILESEIEAARGAACSIICTQPRRISATSVSERVAAERGEKVGESVGYKVRLEGMRGKDTCLLFCTTGVLLRRLVGDRDLKGVTHIIVDEIHERGMNEDFLLVVLKDLLPRRPELRLVLMSATLNAELFSSYFGGAPTLHIPGFTHPVHAHFLENVLEMTGYLLSPDNQIDDYGQEKGWKMQKQVQALKKRKSQIASSVEGALKDADFQKYSMGTQLSLSIWNPDSIGFNLIERVLCHIVKKERPGAVLVFLTGWDDINSLKDKLQAHPLLGNPRKVLLLACHGSMDSSEQRLIFDRPEDGVRKIVLATNMAETSITINDVVFVVDCGKAKETSYDALNNTPCLLPAWISKAAAQQRRGRAGRVQPGECYHLYPKCVYDAFAEYQVPELLRTPLQSLCLQIKSLQLGSISEFLSRALEPPEPLSVQNAVEYLKIIGALDENENLTTLGRKLAILPVEPKLGKMLILGAIFNCLNPIMTIVAGLSVRDPFYVPLERKSLAEAAKAKFAARDYSDHLALVRAYEGWKDAERRQCGYDYCYKNFLSLQALKAIDSVRNQFLSLLKDIGLVGYKSEGANRYKRDELGSEECNRWSDDEHLVRAIICAGLYPGVCSVVNKEKSVALKTMDDGQVLLHANSVNAGVKIPYPWLVFNEKVKVNSVQLRDSTAVSDSVLLLFGGSISRGGLDGHLNMLGGYFEFSMKPALAEMYLSLKRELEELIQKKVLDPKLDLRSVKELLLALKLLISEDQCHGRFVFNNQVPAPSKNREESQPGNFLNGGGGDNPKNELQKLLARKGHGPPTYETSQVEDNQFRSTVIFNGFNIEGRPRNTKKLADMDAAAEALLRLKGKSDSTSLKMSQKKDVGERHSTSTNIDYMSMLREMGQKKDQGESHSTSTSTSTSTNVDYMSLLREMREKKTLFGGGKRR